MAFENPHGDPHRQSEVSIAMSQSCKPMPGRITPEQLTTISESKRWCNSSPIRAVWEYGYEGKQHFGVQQWSDKAEAPAGRLVLKRTPWEGGFPCAVRL